MPFVFIAHPTRKEKERKHLLEVAWQVEERHDPTAWGAVSQALEIDRSCPESKQVSVTFSLKVDLDQTLEGRSIIKNCLIVSRHETTSSAKMQR